MKNAVIFHSTDICEFCEKGNCRRREETWKFNAQGASKKPNQPKDWINSSVLVSCTVF